MLEEAQSRTARRAFRAAEVAALRGVVNGHAGLHRRDPRTATAAALRGVVNGHAGVQRSDGLGGQALTGLHGTSASVDFRAAVTAIPAALRDALARP